MIICILIVSIVKVNKSTLNVDGWEQGITAEKIKEELNNFQADQFDYNSYKLRKPTENINKILNIYENENFNFLLPSDKEIKLLRNSILSKKI